MTSSTPGHNLLDLGGTRPLGEGLNFLTHAMGLVASLAGAVALMWAAARSDEPGQIFACGVYAASLVVVYGASTLSHAFYQPAVRHFFRRLDQTCIFLLIAGSYTPWGLHYYRDGWGLILLLAMWSLAIVGALFKWFVKGLGNIATACYVLLGWMPLLAIKPMLERVPAGGLACLLGGGLLYTLGTWFLSRDVRFSYFHAVWHLLVIAASACHFAGVMLYVVPPAGG